MEAIIVNGRELEAHQVIDGVLVDPATPPLEKIDMIRRSPEDLDLWRDRPFIIKTGAQWKVMCLDGRFRNGATLWAVVDTVEQALRFAKRGWLHPEGVRGVVSHPGGAEGHPGGVVSHPEGVRSIRELLGGRGGSNEVYPRSKIESDGAEQEK